MRQSVRVDSNDHDGNDGDDDDMIHCTYQLLN
jgi:hypothetical protein